MSSTSRLGMDDRETNVEMEYRPSVSLVNYEPPVPLAQKDAWKSTPEGKQNAQIIDILNSILPPVTYQDEELGVQMVQRVSAMPSSRDDVLSLQVRLNQLLRDREARERGICPVREELYAQCFDELIRQVAIESPERGMLLLRARDEARMTVSAYQTLYEASIAFGTRKTSQIEKGNAEFEQKIAELVKTKRTLQAQLQDQRGLYEALEKRNAEIRLREQKKAQDELDFLTQQALQLESFINSNRVNLLN